MDSKLLKIVVVYENTFSQSMLSPCENLGIYPSGREFGRAGHGFLLARGMSLRVSEQEINLVCLPNFSRKGLWGYAIREQTKTIQGMRGQGASG